MRRTLSLFLALILIFSLAACGKKNSDVEVVKEYESQVPEDNAKGEQKIVLSSIETARDFKNGYSWVELSGSKSVYSLVDTKGNVIYTSPQNTYPRNMSNDACFIIVGTEKDKYEYMIINKKGEIVASSAEGNFDKILASGDNLFLVYKYEGGIDSSRHLYGVVNEKGEFVNELRECPFIEELDLYSQSGVRDGAKYIGAKSFQLTGKWDYYRYHHVVYMPGCDTYFLNYENPVEGIGDSLYIRNKNGIEVENGKNEYSSQDYRNVVVGQNGKIEKTTSFDYIENGLLMTKDEEKKITSFTDPTMGKTSVFSKYYPIASFDPADNNLLIMIYGKDGNKYFTVLDKNCNILFEPVSGRNAYAGEGKVRLYTQDGCSVLDYSGNVLINSGMYKQIDDFSNGVAWAKNLSDQYVLIDEKGNSVIS